MTARILLTLLPIALVAALIPAVFATDKASAAPASQAEEPPTLTVAIKTIEPFVFYTSDGKLTGFSIELWEAIARETGVLYEWLEVETVHDQLNAVAEGTADVAIAAISMTAEREERIDFSYPYFDAGLLIMTVPRGRSWFGSIFAILLTPNFVFAVGALLLVIVALGHIVWLVERRHNDDFPHTYARGVWEGIWWAAVTVTTVGYGDRTPRAFWGRLIGLFWMFGGLFVIANFTAAVTTQLTVDELRASITGVKDLPGKKLVTVADSTSADWLRANRLSFLGVETIDEAYPLLENGRVDAIIFDAPVLLYKAATDPGELVVVGDLFNREHYGIAMPTNSNYEDAINRTLLLLSENGTYDTIHEKWFVGTRYE